MFEFDAGIVISLVVGTLVVLVLIVLFSSYKKARPDEALIISGLRSKPKAIVGRSGYAIPFLQRVDRLSLALIQIDVKANRIPTCEFININVDAVANVQVPNDKEFIQLAALNFLNKRSEYVQGIVQQVLEGNMREIVGQLELRSLVNRRDEFASKVQENVTDDMARIGMKVINFTVQNFTDDHDAISNLGVDNLTQISKSAKVARANAERDVKIAEAAALQEANKAQVDSEKMIAEQNRDLAISQSKAKTEADSEKAKAEAAFEIQRQVQQLTINENEVNAETAKAEKMLELREKEIELKVKELDASIKKKADADRYAMEQAAEADKRKKILEAEAAKEAQIRAAEGTREAMIKEAEGIKAKGEAEAAALRAKLTAQAEGIEKQALAQAKMQQASIIEMIVNQLPSIAREISAPLNNVENITIYDPAGTTKLVEAGTRNVTQILDLAKATGIDLQALINNYIAKVPANKASGEKTEVRKKRPTALETKTE